MIWIAPEGMNQLKLHFRNLIRATSCHWSVGRMPEGASGCAAVGTGITAGTGVSGRDTGLSGAVGGWISGCRGVGTGGCLRTRFGAGILGSISPRGFLFTRRAADLALQLLHVL
jgi:hypothetical protein